MGARCMYFCKVYILHLWVLQGYGVIGNARDDPGGSFSRPVFDARRRPSSSHWHLAGQCGRTDHSSLVCGFSGHEFPSKVSQREHFQRSDHR